MIDLPGLEKEGRDILQLLFQRLRIIPRSGCSSDVGKDSFRKPVKQAMKHIGLNNAAFNILNQLVIPRMSRMMGHPGIYIVYVRLFFLLRCHNFLVVKQILPGRMEFYVLMRSCQ